MVKNQNCERDANKCSIFFHTVLHETYILAAPCISGHRGTAFHRQRRQILAHEPEQCRKQLLAGPQRAWLKNRWRRCEQRRARVGVGARAKQELLKLLAREECVARGQQHAGDHVVLNETANRLA